MKLKSEISKFAGIIGVILYNFFLNVLAVDLYQKFYAFIFMIDLYDEFYK